MSEPKWTPGPWRECGHARGGCTCGQVWSIRADFIVAAVTIGEWGDTTAELRKKGRKYEAVLEMLAYGSIPEAIGKANARLIAAAPELYDALDGLLRAIAAERVTGPPPYPEEQAMAIAAVKRARGEEP